MVLFGYMDLLIVAKWLTDFKGVESTAPSVISTMIGMALNGGNLEKGQTSVLGSPETQKGISIFFLLVALVCVPTMLLPKPIIINKANQAHHVLLH